MKELFEALLKCMEKGKDTVLVTVIESFGSTPRSEGARMLISEDGLMAGTVGGGAVEYRCQELAKQVLCDNKGRVEQFILAPNEVADLGMICGGNVQMLFQYLPVSEEIEMLCRQALMLISQKESAWLVTEVGVEKDQRLSIYCEGNGWLGKAFPYIKSESFGEGKKRVKIADQEYHIEPLVQKGKVYIFGGGHVSQALVPVLETLDFHCVVYEDRQSFLTRKLFPKAQELVLGDFSTIADSVKIDNEDYCLVMTRGHEYDFTLQEQLLKTDARYIGVMGSKRKIAVQVKKLKADGFTDKEIQRITMPVGLAIKGETPAELAISIAGQLILERATV